MAARQPFRPRENMSSAAMVEKNSNLVLVLRIGSRRVVQQWPSKYARPARPASPLSCKNVDEFTPVVRRYSFHCYILGIPTRMPEFPPPI